MRTASTVIILRDGPAGVEVLLVRRHLKSDFVGGAHVFPGGVVDPEDRVDESLCAGLDDSSASAALRIDSGGLAFWVAAVRECFEETGIMFAYDSSGKPLDGTDQQDQAWLSEQRRRLQEGKISFAEMIRECRLVLATDRLHYWAHWITPEDQRRRYDTRFFLASVPSGQPVAHDGNEISESSWINPGAAIQKAKAGEWMMVLPTLYNLKMLSRFVSVAEAENAARTRSPEPAILPRLARGPSGVRILLPGDPEYGAATPTAASAEEIGAGSLARIEEEGSE